MCNNTTDFIFHHKTMYTQQYMYTRRFNLIFSCIFLLYILKDTFRHAQYLMKLNHCHAIVICWKILLSECKVGGSFHVDRGIRSVRSDQWLAWPYWNGTPPSAIIIFYFKTSKTTCGSDFVFLSRDRAWISRIGFLNQVSWPRECSFRAV